MPTTKNEPIQLALWGAPKNYAYFDEIWLPHKPLASNKKTGAYKRYNRATALSMSYIETNPLALRNLIIIDHDSGDADHIANRVGLPEPSYIAMNSHTRGGHIAYIINTPVITTDLAHRRPINLLACVEQGLNTVLDGDHAYAGRITKNPYNPDHLALWGDNLKNGLFGTQGLVRTYSLHDLATPLKALTQLPTYKALKPLTTSDLGRNCYLFDAIRIWSYPRRKKTPTIAQWENTIFTKAWEINETFIAENFDKGPLHYKEVVTISRSIARWTWQRIHYSPGELNNAWSKKQAHRGYKGGLKTKIDRKALIEEAL